MKIGIITITEGENYGNRLQNYAVQHFIEQGDNIVETIHNYKDYNIYKYRLKKFIKRFANKESKAEKERKKFFEKFNKENIKFSKYTISNKNISKNINKNYDYFICGSDQIWNSNYKENGFVNFLQFADKEKRIALSPSFGTLKINSNYIDLYKKWINEIPTLSVREDAGKKIIEELTGRKDVEVLIDPTMLLTDEEWDKVSKKPKMLHSQKYILNYFLGELSQSRKEEINRVAKENDCEVIDILDKNSPFYQTGPSEFLYLEKNAFLICTDSFHSCVFAILYNRPFVVFEREDNTVSMNSRIETLINKFQLENRIFKNSIIEENIKHDYTNAYKILEQERNKSMKFLKKALESKE